MLKSFLRSLDKLYRLSDQCPPDVFRIEALRLLDTLVQFDGAVLNIGSTVTSFRSKLIAEHVHSEMGNDCPLGQCVLDIAGTAAGAANGDGVSIICNRDHVNESSRMRRLREFAQEHGATNLLLSASFADARDPRWIVLYRENERGFSKIEAGILRHFWRHFLQANVVNLNRVLNDSYLSHHSRAMGLLNSSGILEAADAALVKLIKLEWPDFDGDRLAIEAVDDLFAENMFRGRRIEILAFAKFGYLICEARPMSVFNLLAPTEKKVASLFASGITHSQIAEQLGVSPYTVRNQLAQIYQKLDIHSKAELARLIAKA
ncbi:MAG: helix-turn-helix transcriptional regulator [Noviherbaspirillum sp.]